MNAPLTVWNPFEELNQLQNRLSSLFVRTNGNDTLAGGRELAMPDWTPAVDVAEDDDRFTITADLPDVKKDDVKVIVENGILTISGERHSESEEKDSKKKFHRVERSYGKYERRFQLPDSAEFDEVDAKFKEGVLTVAIPKSKKAEAKSKAKQIAIR